MINVTDLVPVGGGMLITFDDGSVATALSQVINGRLVYTGLTTEQNEALFRFNQQNIPIQTQQLDARFGAIQNTAIVEQEEVSEGLSGDVAQNTSDIAILENNRQLYQDAYLVNGNQPPFAYEFTGAGQIINHAFTQLIIINGTKIARPWCFLWPDEDEYTSGYPWGVNVYELPTPPPGETTNVNSFILPFASGHLFVMELHPSVGITSPEISQGDKLVPSPLGTVTQWQSGYWAIGEAVIDPAGGYVVMRGFTPDNSTGNKGGPTPIAVP